MNSLPFSDLRPKLVLADSSPLIHLAAVGQLDLLFRFGGEVVIADIVHHETCLDQSKAFAPEIADWIELHKGHGLTVGETDLGPVYKMAVEQSVQRPRNSGERAIVEWLAEEIVHEGGPALIIYENGKVPNMLRREGLPEEVVVVTTRYFFKLAQERGFIADAEEMWTRVAELDPRSNPQAEATVIQRTI